MLVICVHPQVLDAQVLFPIGAGPAT